jgi:hypothetical protein
VTGSTLVTVHRHQAGDWQQALACLGRRLPVGWDASGERIGGVAGYDLILAVPRALSALAWFLMSAGEEELADPILQAHHDALTAVAVEFGCAIGAEAPSMAGPRPQLGPPALVARPPGLRRAGRHQPRLHPA